MTERDIAFTLAAAQRYAAQGRLEEWLHAFLLAEGNNLPLSHGLRLQQRYWFGPQRFPLRLLIPCCGPDASIESPVPPEAWGRKVTAMCARLDAGWEPPPRLAHYRAGGALSLRDGNHRHTALTRRGVEDYWTIAWFDHEEDYWFFRTAHGADVTPSCEAMSGNQKR